MAVKGIQIELLGIATILLGIALTTNNFIGYVLGDVINNSGLREMLSKSIEQNLMTKIKSGQMLCKDCGKVTTEGRLIHEVVSGDDEFSERVIVYIQCFDCARKEIDGRITE